MKDSKINVGDLVKHKTAEFKMVVAELVQNTGKPVKYKCSWFNKEISGDYSGFHYQEFDEHELEKFK